MRRSYYSDGWGCLIIYLGGGVSLGYEFNAGWLFYALYYGLPIGYIFISSLYSRFLEEKLNHYLRSKRKCSHGIIGGETANKCKKCKEIKLKRDLEIKEEKLEKEQKQKIIQKAFEIRKNEIKRITSANLRRIDFLVDLSPNDFEDFVAELFRKLGCV